jgi:hypothetical protein
MADAVRILRDLSVDLSKPLPFKDPAQLYSEVDITEEKNLAKYFPRVRIWHPASVYFDKYHICHDSNDYSEDCMQNHNLDIPKKAIEEGKLAQELDIFDEFVIWETRLGMPAAAVVLGLKRASNGAGQYYLITAFGNEDYLNKVNEEARKARNFEQLGPFGKICAAFAFFFSLAFAISWTIAPLVGAGLIYCLGKENMELREQLKNLRNKQIDISTPPNKERTTEY